MSGPVNQPFDLSDPRRALLEVLLRQKGLGTAAPAALGIPRRTGGGPALLSFAQERLWFLDQMQPGQPCYNVPAAMHLTGPLDTAALGCGLTEIVRRHEALRTTFAVAGGRPVQVVGPPRPVPLPVADLSLLPEPDRVAEARRLAVEEARRPFDLASGPLLRANLWRLGEQEHLLLVTLHHVVTDGWSLGVLIREFGALYTAFRAGRASPLPALPVQYADFAVWQREWLQGDELARRLDYWTERLRGMPPLDLPTDRSRPPTQTYRGAAITFELSRPLTEALLALARAEGATAYAVLLAAFQALLGRYSGQSDFGVGTPAAGRTRAETEALIGFFVNTLVARADLSGNPTLRELIARTRLTALGALDHQDLPFERLVAELQPGRELSRHPLVQVMFTFLNAHRETLRLPGLQATRLDVPTGATHFDLSLTLRESDRGLVGGLEYSTDLFDGATARGLVDHYRRLLEAVAADPGVRVGDVPLLTAAEREQVLVGWNPPRPAPADGRCLHQLFEAHAARTPEAEAVVCGAESLTYGELDRRANRLAHALRRLGVGPEVCVGVCLDRSADLVVSLLAVLKAGGAYVPVDPAYPRERLAVVLDDVRPRVVLTQERFRAHLPADGCTVLCTDVRSLDGESDENPRTAVAADNLAYVIHTSGSTGRPKGCLVTHRNVARLLRATAPEFGFDERDTWTLFHSYAFDFSVWELWGALAHGGRLVVVPYHLSRSPAAVHDLVCREGVTVLNQTPSAFYQLAQAAEGAPAGQRPPLRVVIFGGEALDVTRLRPWFARHGAREPRLVNMYGITETTVHVTSCPLSAADPGDKPGSPIGRPIPGWRVYVLDRRLRPVPVGVPGEVYVGGDGVARGYLGAPDATAERFVPDPFGPSGCRLYRSGDRARWRADGTLEYLGRVDQQVKIRGFRIEPGEVEAALLAHPAVRQAAVVAREDAPGDKRLVAYVVPRSADACSEADLRGFLQEKLPEYARPAACVFLTELPLTPNGKLDRRALPPPDPTRATSAEPVAPRDALEGWVADVWREALGLGAVGVEDNFFAAGGDSIRAALVVNRVQRRLGRPVPVTAIFEAPTAAGFARFLADHYPAAAGLRDGLVVADADGATDPGPWGGSPEALLADLDKLTDAQVEALLGDLDPGEAHP
jgi:amino acid adenylation domain-containing protein